MLTETTPGRGARSSGAQRTSATRARPPPVKENANPDDSGRGVAFGRGAQHKRAGAADLFEIKLNFDTVRVLALDGYTKDAA